MGDNKVTIISTIFLLGALLSIGMTSDASAPPAVIVDGIINVGEYTNSVVVDRTPDLGGVYDPGIFGSYDDEPFAFGHGDWTLYWDSSPTDLFFAAEPNSDFPSHPGESNLGIHLLPITGDPNTGVGVTGCTGTLYFPFFANGGHFALERCVGPGFEDTIFGGSLPPSSTDTVFQDPVGSIITPIEWSMVRGDLDHFGDTAYTGNLQCLWFQISAFDSRSVSNGGGEGVRTIWLKFDPNTPNCGEDIPPEIEKRLVSGSEEIGISLPGPTAYQYTIEYTGPAALVKDTVPAEFEVLSLVATDGTADDFKPGKGAKSQSSTKIEWLVPAGTSTLTVDIQTVESPGKGHKLTVFKPTSCGPLPINDGATAFEVDANGELVLVEVTDPAGVITLEPVVIVGPSNSLEVEAVAGAKLCIEIDDRDPN